MAVIPGQPGLNYARPPGVNVTGGGGFGAVIEPTLLGGMVTGYTVVNPGRGYTSPPTLTVGANTEVKMVDATPNGWYPPTWPTDGRAGGVPDPFTAGPKFIQIGNEGGFLPEISVRDNQPVNFDYDRGSATFGNVSEPGRLTTRRLKVRQSSWDRRNGPTSSWISPPCPPAPTSSCITTRPAPMPGFQPRYDYYTGNPDHPPPAAPPRPRSASAPTPGRSCSSGSGAPQPLPFNLAALQAAWPNIYLTSQPPPIVPQPYYPGPSIMRTGRATTYATINATTLTYQPVGFTNTVTKALGQKAITEVFEKYGRLKRQPGV